MKQKEIWFANLDPIAGYEQSGVRPVVIISGNAYNKSPLKIICPLTSKIKNYKGTLLLRKNNQNNLSVDSELLTFHIRAIDESRLENRIGSISEMELQTVLDYLDDIWKY